MTDESGTPTGGAPPAPPRRGLPVNEDWAATILGLVLLLAVLAGVIPTGVIP